MALQEQSKEEQAKPAPGSSFKSIVTLTIALVAVTYFGFIRPAQQHLRALERQCSKLSVAVRQLQGRDSTATQSLRLIELLDAQSDKIAAAEDALDELTAVRNRLVEEADQLASATSALEQIDSVRHDVLSYGKTLARTAGTLDEIAAVARAVETSNDMAREARASLHTLAGLQTELVDGLIFRGQQLSSLESQLAERGENIQLAEQTLGRIDRLCKQLTNNADTVATAHERLAALLQLKDDVLSQAADLSAAVATLQEIWDLRDGLLQAGGTVDQIQHMVVDVMLMEPAVDRAVQALRPVVEFTRMTHRLPTEKLKIRQSRETEMSPWSIAIAPFVALLGSTK